MRLVSVLTCYLHTTILQTPGHSPASTVVATTLLLVAGSITRRGRRSGWSEGCGRVVIVNCARTSCMCSSWIPAYDKEGSWERIGWWREGSCTEFTCACHIEMKELVKNACLRFYNFSHVQTCIGIVIMCGESLKMFDLGWHVYNTQSVRSIG
jgi:hypothetical protein